MKRRAFIQSVVLGSGRWALGAVGAFPLDATDRRQPAAAGAAAPDSTNALWTARWIALPGAPAADYGVYHFRRAFDLPQVPASFVVHVTADNRYQLYVNGARVAWGPARGDLNHWRYETVDVAAQLRRGRNVVAAVVWNGGELAAEAQVTNRTAFLLQGHSAVERVLDTNAAWTCIRNDAYGPEHHTHGQMRGYFVAGPAERVDGARYPWGWEQPDFDASAWTPAYSDGRWRGAPRDAVDAPNRWLLVPRRIPFMEERVERLAAVRLADGVTAPSTFPREAAPFTVAPHTRARLLLDQSHLTTAYPELVVSRGAGAVVRLGYAESLFVDPAKGLEKGHRDEVEGKTFVGYRDVFTADGGTARVFRPLWWRTYRYVELDVETKAEPLTIEDLRGTFTAYPFEMKARFDAGADRIARLLDVGWRTARLCAHETYMDCPYYEQLQYAGDTRIQALVSYFNAGDGRLARNAIAQLNDSRTAEGATMSRAPTRQQQYIPPFSLWWIGMVHDYWRYQDDEAFVREMLPGVRAVLEFFARHQQDDGRTGRLPWWNFVDWAWPNRGIPPMEPDGSSAPIDLQRLLALDWARELEAALGAKALAAAHGASAAALRAAIRQTYWNASRSLFADTATGREFSQHTNALAVLAGVVTRDEARQLVNRVLRDASLTPCTLYFRHYLHSAVNHAGEGDRYLDLLGDWDAMLQRGLTTWAEKQDPTRSDCHAWSASPNFEIFRTVLGIDSAAPRFARVSIRPFLGKLTRASGAIPHPRGEIAVSYAIGTDGRLAAEISLPPGVSGLFEWRGTRRDLPAGRSRFTV